MKNEKNNRLNDLDGKEWVKLTKSVWHNITNVKEHTKVENALQTGILFSRPSPRDDLTKMHPATFADDDVAKLVRFFTIHSQEGSIFYKLEMNCDIIIS